MRRSSLLPIRAFHTFILIPLVTLFYLASPVHAAITLSGDVSPSDSANWDSSTTGYVGNTSDGTLTVDLGDSLFSSYCYIGYYSNAAGVATITGSSSTWSNSHDLYVGEGGHGTLNILDNGSVVIGGQTYVAYDPGSTGTINFMAGGGTLTTLGLYASPLQLTGTGTIRANGIVSDIDLVFDSDQHLIQNNLPGFGNIRVDLDISSTTNVGDLGAGYRGSGSLMITNGITVTSGRGEIGFGPNSTGVVNVDGVNSQWNNLGGTIVGWYGDGTLNITNGGSVVSYASSIGPLVGCTGSLSTVTVDGSGSIWDAGRQLVVGGGSERATLMIANGGTVNSGSYSSPSPLSDAIICPAIPSGLPSTVTVDGAGSTWNQKGTLKVGGELNITRGGTVNSGPWGQSSNYYGLIDGGSDPDSTAVVRVDGIGSNWNVASDLRIGSSGNGVMVITNGGTVRSGPNGSGLGYDLGSTGLVKVEGAASKWTVCGVLPVGYGGSGTLLVINGSTVSSDSGAVGVLSGSSGMAIIEGSGSIWMSRLGLTLGGDGGTGIVSVIGGGAMTIGGFINSPLSWLTIDVGRGSLLSVNNEGTGMIVNDGKIRFIAGAGVGEGESYVPITATVWSGTGICQAVGGTLDTSNHQFTVSEVVGGTAGIPVEIDRALRQRVLINDSENSWNVGASFLAAPSSSTLSFTASVMDDGILEDLETLLGEDRPVLGAWEFEAEGGYAEGDPAYLSFDVGPGYSSNGLRVWHYNGTEWTPYDAMDLTYDGAYASFTVTGFSGYAVAVPEPATIWLLLLGLAWAGWVRRRR